jgi:hypothetical protein
MVVNHEYLVLVYNVDEINVTKVMAVAVKQMIVMLIDLLISDLNVYPLVYEYKRILIEDVYE